MQADQRKRRVRLTPEQGEVVYTIAEETTGTCQKGRYRHDILITNVERRIASVGALSFEHYLQLVNESEAELAHLISALTIHTTSWFRESPHFVKIQEIARNTPNRNSGSPFKVLCAACSTGEEVYSVSLVLEHLKRSIPGFDYKVLGIDIDPVSIDIAKRGVYRLEMSRRVPIEYKQYLLKGTGPSDGYFTLNKIIRDRAQFEVANLKTFQPKQSDYDLILCRNVLIYFSPPEVDEIVSRLAEALTPGGSLCLGHSESIDRKFNNLELQGGSVFRKLAPTGGNERSRILVVDDSATIRKTVQGIMEQHGFDVLTAHSADSASAVLEKTNVDIITLDLNMPGTSGQVWLRSRRASGMRTPVVILSGVSQLDAVDVLGALQNGAQDYIDKSALARSGEEVAIRIKEISNSYRGRKSGPTSNRAQNNLKRNSARPDLILIGASTGGTEALVRLLANVPKPFPPVLVTQHITSAFASAFAQRLAERAGLTLADPETYPELRPDTLYIPQSDYHLELSQSGSKVIVQPNTSAPINRHRPSVDVMFRSATRIESLMKFAVLLTGMGADGAQGLDELRRSGAMTCAQSEDSCVVFGMPREAIRLGAAQFIGSPEEIRAELERILRHRRIQTSADKISKQASVTAGPQVI